MIDFEQSFKHTFAEDFNAKFGSVGLASCQATGPLTLRPLKWTMYRFVTIYVNVMANRTGPSLPLPVTRALRKLGGDIRDARRRRRIPTAMMAERAAISRTTLLKVEQGDPGVQVGIYATVLFILGLADRIGTLADVRDDRLGLELEEDRLPQRIRLRPQPRPKHDEG